MGQMNTALKIEGVDGKQVLSGTIPVYGSKNAALIMLPACILFSDEVVLSNIPEIEDINRMIELLAGSGVSIKRKKRGTYSVSVKDKLNVNLDDKIVGRIRASVFLIAPTLARYGRVTLPYPGGDNIGTRPIDLFIEGLEKMGARCIKKNNRYEFSIDGKLHGTEFFLRIQSVGVTQSILLAGILAEGTTVIKNAAMEPEIVSLAKFLIECGANIKGAGTPEVTIVGGPLLKASKRTFVNIPDRLETGTFTILGALSGKKVKISNCNPAHIQSLLSVLEKSVSSEISVSKNSITIKNTKPLSVLPIDVRTHEYPGFATDLQPPLVVLLTQALGKSLIFETIYEERFNYIGNLIHMGAKIITYDPHRIRVHGKTSLSGATCTSPDIRAGLAYILAAIVAKGTSVIHNVYVIDRGYEKIEERLFHIGVNIKRK